MSELAQVMREFSDSFSDADLVLGFMADDWDDDPVTRTASDLVRMGCQLADEERVWIGYALTVGRRLKVLRGCGVVERRAKGWTLSEAGEDLIWSASLEAGDDDELFVSLLNGKIAAMREP